MRPASPPSEDRKWNLPVSYRSSPCYCIVAAGPSACWISICWPQQPRHWLIYTVFTTLIGQGSWKVCSDWFDLYHIMVMLYSHAIKTQGNFFSFSFSGMEQTAAHIQKIITLHFFGWHDSHQLTYWICRRWFETFLILLLDEMLHERKIIFSDKRHN